MVIDPSFCVFLAFIAFFCLIGKKAWFFLTNYLDQRAEMIKKDIEDAHILKESAQNLLNQALLFQHEVNDKIEEIKSHAQSEIEHSYILSLQEVDTHLKLEEAQAKEKLELATLRAMKDIEEKVINMALLASRKILSEQTDEAFHNHLFSEALNKISYMNDYVEV